MLPDLIFVIYHFDGSVQIDLSDEGRSVLPNPSVFRDVLCSGLDERYYARGFVLIDAAPMYFTKIKLTHNV